MEKMGWIKDDFQLWLSGQLGAFPQGACVHIKRCGQEFNPRSGKYENAYFAASSPDELHDFGNSTLFESDFEQII